MHVYINHKTGMGITMLLTIHIQKSTDIQLCIKSIYTNYTKSREYSPLLRSTVLLQYNFIPFLRSTVLLYDTLLLY